ncbi:hypothetical protein FOXYSP1_16691 [Fusarium oxysporum f. sp. phaseoli]
MRRKHFYTRLIEMIAQLPKLEFKTSASLMPDHDRVPVVDEVLSIPPNQHQINRNEARSLPTCNPATSFILRRTFASGSLLPCYWPTVAPNPALNEPFPLISFQFLVNKLPENPVHSANPTAATYLRNESCRQTVIYVSAHFHPSPLPSPTHVGGYLASKCLL